MGWTGIIYNADTISTIKWTTVKWTRSMVRNGYYHISYKATVKNNETVLTECWAYFVVNSKHLWEQGFRTISGSCIGIFKRKNLRNIKTGRGGMWICWPSMTHAHFTIFWGNWAIFFGIFDQFYPVAQNQRNRERSQITSLKIQCFQTPSMPYVIFCHFCQVLLKLSHCSTTPSFWKETQ